MNQSTPLPVRPREPQRAKLHRASRHQALAVAAMVGLTAGGVAVFFRTLVSTVEEHGPRLAQWISHSGTSGMLCLLAAGGILGALAGWITSRYCPEAGGSGIPHTKAVLMGARTLRPVRVIAVKIGAGLLALAAGMSLGREGPTVHIGAASGLLVAQRLGLRMRTRKPLLAAGAGAGLAAAFNAPLAGFLFVMEELKRDLSPMTYGTALVASVAAVAVERMLLDQRPAFLLTDPAPIPLVQLPALAALGIVMALVGILFNRLLLAGVRLRVNRQLPRPLLGGIAGALSAGLLLAMPQVTCGGIPLAQEVLAGNLSATPLSALLLLVAAKLVLTAACFMTGVPGGIFAPMLVMGSLAGLLLGLLGQVWMPLLTPPPVLMATAGMAAMLAASVRAPLTGVVLIIEMTGQYTLLFGLLLAGAVAYACAELLGDRPVYEALLQQDLATGQEAAGGQEEIIDVIVEPHSVLDGRRVGDLRMPAGMLLATVERSQQMLVPRAHTVLRAGDMLTVLLEANADARWLATFVEAARGP